MNENLYRFSLRFLPTVRGQCAPFVRKIQLPPLVVDIICEWTLNGCWKCYSKLNIVAFMTLCFTNLVFTFLISCLVDASLLTIFLIISCFTLMISASSFHLCQIYLQPPERFFDLDLTRGGLYRSSRLCVVCGHSLCPSVRRSVAPRMMDDWLMIDDWLIDGT